MKNRLFLALKVLFSIALILIVIEKINVTQLFQLIQAAEIRFFVYAFTMFAVMHFLSVLRWKILLQSNNIVISIKNLIFIHLVGLFFRYLLPTSVGEEIVKIAKVAKTAGNLSDVTMSALYARVIGLMIMLVVSLMALSFTYQVLSSYEIQMIFIGIFGFISLILILIRTPHLFLYILKTMNIFREANVFCKLVSVAHKLVGFRLPASLLLQATGLSVFIFLASAAAIHGIARGFHIEIPLRYLLAFLPLISVATLFPLTFNGVGVREGIYIYFFSRLGASPTEILLLPLTEYLLIAIFGLMGGIGYLLENLAGARRAAALAAPVVRRDSEHASPLS